MLRLSCVASFLRQCRGLQYEHLKYADHFNYVIAYLKFIFTLFLNACLFNKKNLNKSVDLGVENHF